MAHLLPGAVLTPNEPVTLLIYGGSRSGTFQNAPAGSSVQIAGSRFRLDYGDGSNDAITLTYAPTGTDLILN